MEEKRLPVIEIRDATVRTEHGHRMLEGVSIRVEEGEHTAILGPNGSGKTSLIHLVTHHRRPWTGGGTTGSVRVFGRERWNVSELRRLLGVVSATPATFVLGNGRGPTGLELALSGFFAAGELFPHHEVTDAMRDRARAALELMEASHLAARHFRELSTGEARRVVIARALAPDPRALLLDEPTAGLDLVAMRRLTETLRRVAAAGKTIVLVTHHVEEIFPEVARVVLLSRGHVLAAGPRPELLTAEMLSRTFEAPVEVVEREDGYVEARGR
jgi:iron complex transport system ATP-binding protein